MTRMRATLIGFVAVILWALLALLTVGSAPTPPLLLNTICFTIGGTCGLIWTYHSGGFAMLRSVPLRVYISGTLGLFGYHALYFSALRLAPAAEAGLIAYLWPLLIVILSGLLPGEEVRRGHLIGAAIGFTGAALIISGGGSGFRIDYLPGYGLALICALTWSSYSVLSRLVGDAPTQSVTVFCLGAAALSLPLHLIFEDTVFPQSALGWSATLLLGLGPVGLAFFVWDIGVKQGDIQLLGAASYAAPLLSTLVLVMAGVAPLSATLGIAAILVTGGAMIAARASLRKNASSTGA
ncbi:aromatic amino acid exporter YddG [Roseobacter sp. MH60115]|uniref:aromatic amino acid exporter YddG n=1 Tax=Roseobacter sp. MH60115 TaxID=2785324 RepID=UPI0018A27FBC|nr:EamA family transporter [Roseobacter sp. MH60115]